MVARPNRWLDDQDEKHGQHGEALLWRRANAQDAAGTLQLAGQFQELAEFLSIALDASVTHMYAPGTRRHIKAALKHGATMEEIMEVLKICVAEGLQACNLGVAILAEELERCLTGQPILQQGIDLPRQTPRIGPDFLVGHLPVRR